MLSQAKETNMSDINLDALSLEELTALQQKAQEAVDAKRDEEITQAYELFQNTAKKLGVSIEEIIKRGMKAKAKVKKPARYQNPDNPEETWSGFGRKPAWLATALEAGFKLEDFEIKSN